MGYNDYHPHLSIVLSHSVLHKVEIGIPADPLVGNASLQSHSLLFVATTPISDRKHHLKPHREPGFWWERSNDERYKDSFPSKIMWVLVASDEGWNSLEKSIFPRIYQYEREKKYQWEAGSIYERIYSTWQNLINLHNEYTESSQTAESPSSLQLTTELFEIVILMYYRCISDEE